ncbi:hypothetical protein SLEP1_g55852 [Rubroshorea leprosula]|uniref:Uncharacterized protein n=1 Tax=Rubroshorea leprosula TaxID=152421 RepID=A0AAV5MJQ3_9ROSI|nr:hypothetical protein SLEP1_g55852 [Rubroshorea leprosula]
MREALNGPIEQIWVDNNMQEVNRSLDDYQGLTNVIQNLALGVDELGVGFIGFQGTSSLGLMNPVLGSWNPGPGIVRTQSRVLRNQGSGFQGTPSLSSSEPRVGFQGTQALGSREPRALLRPNPKPGWNLEPGFDEPKCQVPRNPA